MKSKIKNSNIKAIPTAMMYPNISCGVISFHSLVVVVAFFQHFCYSIQHLLLYLHRQVVELHVLTVLASDVACNTAQNVPIKRDLEKVRVVSEVKNGDLV